MSSVTRYAARTCPVPPADDTGHQHSFGSGLERDVAVPSAPVRGGGEGLGDAAAGVRRVDHLVDDAEVEAAAHAALEPAVLGDEAGDQRWPVLGVGRGEPFAVQHLDGGLGAHHRHLGGGPGQRWPTPTAARSGTARAMLGDLLPAGVCRAEAFDDAEPAALFPAALFPAEEALVARAVPGRRREFATARRCARRALAELGFPPASILTGRRGEPCWPAAVAGAITHCAGYRTAAVGRLGEVTAVGVDAEPNAPLPAGVLDLVALPEERAQLGRPGDVCWTGCCSARRSPSTRRATR